MPIKTTYQSFLASVYVLEAASREAVDARMRDQACEKVMLEIPADWALVEIGAKVAIIAFAIELGLKTLLEKECGSTPRGHDLGVLFGQLSQNTKSLIREGVEMYCSSCDENFDQLLVANSQQFVKFRYMHEYESLSSDLEFMGCFLMEINKCVVTA